MRHETPTDAIFQEMKDAATEIWKTYDNEFGYVDEKLEYINSLGNIQDNAMVFYRMFDHINKNIMRSKLSNEALTYIQQNQ